MATTGAYATQAPSEKESRPRARRGLSLFPLVAIVLLGIAGWYAWGFRTAAQVDARWALRCPGGVLAGSDSAPVVRSRAGWRCDLQVTVQNSSSHEVDLTSVDGAFLGPGAGAEVRGLPAVGAPLVGYDRTTDTVDAEGGIDGRWLVDLRVPASSSRTFALPVGWRAKGCNAAGRIRVEDWISVGFDVLGAPHQRTVPDQLRLRTYDDPHDRRCG